MEEIQEADTDDHQGTLDFEEFCSFYKMMSTRRDLYLIMLSYSNHKDHLDTGDLAAFWRRSKRLVALTPVAMKCLEKLVLVHLNNIVPDTIDPLQFAYRPNRSVDDAVSVSCNTWTTAELRLIEKLAELGIPTPTCNWILDFLIERPQVVRIGQRVSDQLTLSTGSPQGCCLSPKLFTLYTHDCVSKHNNTIIIKYADDTTILGLIRGGDESGYRSTVKNIVNYGDENNLILNIDKTKEVVIDFRRNLPAPKPLTIKGTEVEQVDSYKFLGLQITSDLSWKQNTAATVKLYFIRMLRRSGLKQRPLTQAYRGLVESILCTGITVWYGNTTTAERKALQRVIKTAEKMLGTNLPSMETIYTQRCRKRAEKIMKDSSHPVYSLFKHKHCNYSLRQKRADNTTNIIITTTIITIITTTNIIITTTIITIIITTNIIIIIITTNIIITTTIITIIITTNIIIIIITTNIIITTTIITIIITTNIIITTTIITIIITTNIIIIIITTNIIITTTIITIITTTNIIIIITTTNIITIIITTNIIIIIITTNIIIIIITTNIIISSPLPFPRTHLQKRF
ncbi:hypothetical protein WMY93_027151 [Mugilogobius chulae]|uniref:Reverse transcriptase domain-containing protein n=1 Tax=Mugilogobius chulae TaxID=88201 RepID=A0AAW0N2C1_9GOBI